MRSNHGIFWYSLGLTLLLLLCTTAFAKTIECGSIELEQPVEVTFEDYNTLQYTLTAPIDGTRVKVEWLSENKNDAWLSINYSSASSTDGIFTLKKEKNTIQVGPTSSNLFPLTVRFVLHEYRNDEQEPNDVIPTELHDGDSVKFVLDGGDKDRFTITTEKPGQDIALTFSGFNYADRTAFSLFWNNRGWEIEKNGTVFLHAGEPGTYQFSLSKSGSGEISRSMEIHLLDGDENELNDTKETATPLPIGTDAAFSIGGINDEDWFSFEAVPEDGQAKLYTLRLLDFAMRSTHRTELSLFLKPRSVPVMRASYRAASRGSMPLDYIRKRNMIIIVRNIMFQSSAQRSASAWRRAAMTPMKATIPGSTQPILSRAS